MNKLYDTLFWMVANVCTYLIHVGIVEKTLISKKELKGYRRLYKYAIVTMSTDKGELFKFNFYEHPVMGTDDRHQVYFVTMEPPSTYKSKHREDILASSALKLERKSFFNIRNKIFLRALSNMFMEKCMKFIHFIK